MKKPILAACLLLSSLGAQIRWTPLSSTRGELPSPAGSKEQTACVVGDFNNDGRGDFAIASRKKGGRLEAWLSRSTGAWDLRVIDASDFSPEAGGAVHDVDRDGDLDIVLGQDNTGRELYWWENPYPDFSRPWTRRLVNRNTATKHHDQAFGDVDGDGRAELISWNQGSRQLQLYEIPSDPRKSGTWKVSTIWTAPNAFHEGLAIGDMDGDGKDDIVGAGRWWKHVSGTRFQEHVIDASMNFTQVAIGQLVAGGRPEVVFVPGDSNGQSYWYQWAGSSWSRTALHFAYHGHSVAIADLDLDGKQDILIGEMQNGRLRCELAVWRGNGSGAFSKQLIKVGDGIHSGRLTDVDADGDLDIVHKPFNDETPRIQIWRNESARLRLDQWKRVLAAPTLGSQAVFVRSGDLDGDGKEDVVAGDAWYRQPSKLSGSWTRRAIGGVFKNLAAIHDFDGDGDLDLLGTRGSGSQANSQFAWAENDGFGNFTVRTNIPAGRGDFLQGAVVGRFTKSGPLEVALSWHAQGGGVQMLTVPANPATQAWTWRRLSTTNEQEDLSIGDIDADGDMDLFLGTRWLEAPTWTTRIVGRVDDLQGIGGKPEADRNSLADIDLDGDLDAVVSLENGRDIVWFENPGVTRVRGLWKRHVLGQASGQGFSMDVGDMDGDADPDVVLGEHRGVGVNRVLLFENEGRKTGWKVTTVDSQATSKIDHHDGTQIVDLDRDGDPDIVSIGWRQTKLWIFENLSADGRRPPRVEAPIVDCDGSVFQTSRIVTLSTATPAADIRFTLDGKVPTQASPKYLGPLAVRSTLVLTARAFKSGLESSEPTRLAFAKIDDDYGRWRFDEANGATAQDDSRQRRDGKLVQVNRASGRVGRAIEFPGSYGQIRLPTFDVSSKALTIAAWIRPDRHDHLASADARILSKATGFTSDDHVFMLSTITSKFGPVLRFRLKTLGVTSTLVANSGVIVNKKWQHIAGVYDGQRMLVYKDGVQVGTTPKFGAIDAAKAASVWIGDNPPNGGRNFDGLMDDIRLFRRALSPTEVAALANDFASASAKPYGTSGRACAGSILQESIRGPRVGESSFMLASVGIGVQLPGVWIVSAQALPGIPIPGTSAALWVRPDPGYALILPALSSASGQSIIALPTPPIAASQALFTQSFWLASPCQGVLGSSHALELRRVKR